MNEYDDSEKSFRRGFDHGALFVMVAVAGGAKLEHILAMTHIIHKWRRKDFFSENPKRRDFFDFIRKSKNGEELYNFYKQGLKRNETERLGLLR